jgi:DNA-binding IclR family transcriptional regulator
MDSRLCDTSNQPDPALLRRIRSEFLEMPGLRLTLWQASRLWGVDADTCRRAVTRLTAEGFLRRTPEGTYACHCHGSH